jgi:hypothetical protein
MAWGRIDDGSWRHRKFAALRDDLRKPCIALYWMAVSWSNDHGTDGLVTRTGLRQLDGTVEEANELVRVGLWESGYRIHDFLQFNKSVEQLALEKAQRTAAGQVGANARWHPDGTPHSEPHATGHAIRHGSSPSEMVGEMDAPYPVPRTPVAPEPISREWDHIDDDTIALIVELTGRPIAVAGLRQLVELGRQVADHSKDKVVKAYRKAASAYPTKPTARQLVWSARNILEPFATPKDIKAVEAQERESEERRAHENRVAATRRRIDELTGGAA